MLAAVHRIRVLSRRQCLRKHNTNADCLQLSLLLCFSFFWAKVTRIEENSRKTEETRRTKGFDKELIWVNLLVLFFSGNVGLLVGCMNNFFIIISEFCKQFYLSIIR